MKLDLFGLLFSILLINLTHAAEEIANDEQVAAQKDGKWIT